MIKDDQKLHNKDIKKILVLFLFAVSTVCSAFAVDTSTYETSSNTTDKATEAIAEQSNSFFGSAQIAMTTEGYKVTAGDVYELAYAAGSQAVSYIIVVDTSYKIRISNLGVINVRGLTYNQLKTQVELVVSKNYPLSGVQFILKTPAQFSVLFKGEVTQTSELMVWSLSRLSNVVTKVITDYSSLRNILIIDSAGNKSYYDLFLAQRDGDLSNDPYLRPGDTVVVNRIDRKVSIKGMVERPGTYELLKDENLQALITKYASGLAPTANVSRISLVRVNNTNNSGIKQTFKNFTLDQDTVLQNYDEIYVPSYKEVAPAMFITGAINTGIVGTELETTYKKTVLFSQGEDYASLVRSNQELFSSSSDTKNAYILRGQERIAINLDDLLYNAHYNSDILVQADDTLVIPFKQYFVVVVGAVKNPGRFPYIPDRDYSYYIAMAGGIDKMQNVGKKVTITDREGNTLSITDKIEPETNIEVASNSLWYKWTSIAGGFTAILTAIYTLVTVLSTVGVI